MSRIRQMLIGMLRRVWSYREYHWQDAAQATIDQYLAAAKLSRKTTGHVSHAFSMNMVLLTACAHLRKVDGLQAEQLPFSRREENRMRLLLERAATRWHMVIEGGMLHIVVQPLNPDPNEHLRPPPPRPKKHPVTGMLGEPFAEECTNCGKINPDENHLC